MIKFLFLVFAAFVFSGCGTLSFAPNRTSPKEPPKTPAPTSNTKKTTGLGGIYMPRVDMDRLQRELRFRKTALNRGFEEKTFNPCLTQAVSNKPQMCDLWYMGVIHFQVSCRDTQGTVEYVASLEPIKSAQLRWKMGMQRGISKTDSQGRGFIRYISRVSMKYSRIRIYKGQKFLAMRAHALKRLVVPPDWCS